ncbi:hypothetical protein KFL_000540420, partial [Klebsormidium nitens]
LEQLVGAAEEALDRGLAPAAAARTGKAAPAWSTEQYETIVRLLVDSPGGSVSRRVLHKKLGKDGPAAIRSLVDYNILQLQFQVRTSTPERSPRLGAPRGRRLQVFVAAGGAADLIAMREWVAEEAADEDEAAGEDFGDGSDSEADP